jgi:glucose-1-phosphatase
MNPDLSAIKPHIKNIIFDFGGVLFDIDYNAPVTAFKALGVMNFDEIYSQANQLDIFDELECGRITAAQFVSALRDVTGLSLSDEQILTAWNVILLDIPKERAELVHKVKEHFRTFILSNTNAIHVEVFEQIIDRSLGLSWFKSAFEKVYYSNEIGIKKPYPSTYLAICDWHNLVPQETLFIDDSLQHVLGAREAGLHGYHLDLNKEEILEVLGDWAS